MKFDDLYEETLSELENWTQHSIKKFSKTVGKSPNDKGFHSACVDKMTGKSIKNIEGFCARIKDKALGSTMWRGKGKSKDKVDTDVSKNQNVFKFPEEIEDDKDNIK